MDVQEVESNQSVLIEEEPPYLEEDVVEECGSNSEAAGIATKSESSSTETGGTPSAEDQDEIKKEVQKAIDGILRNPTQITSIVNGLKGDKNVLRQVLDFLQKNPQLKKQAMDRAMGSTPTMQELSRMSKKERDEIMKKAKEARKELAALNPTDHKAVLINISRVAKEYPVSAEFPSGSKFCDGTVEELKHGLHYVYLPDEKRVNKRATQIVGQPTCGEIVIFRLDEKQEEVQDFTLEEFNNLFPRTKDVASAPAPAAKSRSRRR